MSERSDVLRTIARARAARRFRARVLYSAVFTVAFGLGTWFGLVLH